MSKAIVHGQRWGKWEYDKTRLALTYHSPEGWHYDVDLEQCKNSSEILDWIVQISQKNWATPADVGYLVRALDELAGYQLQAKVCPSGGRGRIDFKKLLA